MISIFQLTTIQKMNYLLARKPRHQGVSAFSQKLKSSITEDRAPPIFKQVNELVVNKYLYRL